MKRLNKNSSKQEFKNSVKQCEEDKKVKILKLDTDISFEVLNEEGSYVVTFTDIDNYENEHDETVFKCDCGNDAEYMVSEDTLISTNVECCSECAKLMMNDFENCFLG